MSKRQHDGAATAAKSSSSPLSSPPSKKALFSIDGILSSGSFTANSPTTSATDEVVDDDATLDGQIVGEPIGNWPTPGTSPKLANLECKLECKELWSKFYDLSTEMIITKSGRRMFPTVKIRLEGADPDAMYYIFLDVIPVDDRRYRYVYNKSSWLTAGKAEASPESRLYLHPDSPFPGRQLSSQVISFEKAKLTNSDVDRTGHLVLNSMHKYQPRIHVVRRDRSADPISSSGHVELSLEQYKTFQFTETQFMAVTAYQNQLITKLKIEKNPFAKGFRDPGGRSSEIELERHLERLPRFPLNSLTPSSAAAAAALMLNFGPNLAFRLGHKPLPPFGSPFSTGIPDQNVFLNEMAANYNAALGSAMNLNPQLFGISAFPKLSSIMQQQQQQMASAGSHQTPPTTEAVQTSKISAANSDTDAVSSANNF